MEVKSILIRNEISPLEAHNLCSIVADLLRAYATELKRNEPTAFNTINHCEKAAETVNDIGYMIVTEYDHEEDWSADPSEWEDDSNVSCDDCPEDECNGHCMSCRYRPV